LPTAASQVTNGDGSRPGGFTDDVELANAAYGQAETFVTPLQMALVAATVANDGELIKARLDQLAVVRDGRRDEGHLEGRHEGLGLAVGGVGELDVIGEASGPAAVAVRDLRGRRRQ